MNLTPGSFKKARDPSALGLEVPGMAVGGWAEGKIASCIGWG